MTPIDQLVKAETTAPFEGETPNPNGNTTDPNLRIYCGIENDCLLDMTFFADGDVGIGSGTQMQVDGVILTRPAAIAFFKRGLELLESDHGTKP